MNHHRLELFIKVMAIILAVFVICGETWLDTISCIGMIGLCYILIKF